MNGRILSLLCMLVCTSSTTLAQQLQIQPGWSGYGAPDLESADDASLALQPQIEVGRYEVQPEGQPGMYDIDQWSGLAPETDGVATSDLLVFFYDVPWDASMKERVRQADVVDEEATFPIRSETWHAISCSGFHRRAKTSPSQFAIFAPISERNESSRYADVPNGGESFIIIDFAESEHLGMAHGYRGAFQP